MTTHRRGLGLIEAMISLAIVAMLLTAVAAAFRASTDAIQTNDEFFQASQSGRVVLARLLTQVRRGSVDEGSTSTNLRIITDAGQDLAYVYDANTKQITLVTNDDPNDIDHVLARNVTACEFLVEMGTDYNNAQCVKRVTIQLNITVGSNSVFLTDSAALRRNLVY